MFDTFFWFSHRLFTALSNINSVGWWMSPKPTFRALSPDGRVFWKRWIRPDFYPRQRTKKSNSDVWKFEVGFDVACQYVMCNVKIFHISNQIYQLHIRVRNQFPIKNNRTRQQKELSLFVRCRNETTTTTTKKMMRFENWIPFWNPC